MTERLGICFGYLCLSELPLDRPLNEIFLERYLVQYMVASFWMQVGSIDILAFQGSLD